MELWFDVETRYKTTEKEQRKLNDELWFDVETRCKTTGTYFSQILTTIVYHLYDLTYDKVHVIDPETPIAREEYDNFKM